MIHTYVRTYVSVPRDEELSHTPHEYSATWGITLPSAPGRLRSQDNSFALLTNILQPGRLRSQVHLGDYAPKISMMGGRTKRGRCRCNDYMRNACVYVRTYACDYTQKLLTPHQTPSLRPIEQHAFVLNFPPTLMLVTREALDNFTPVPTMVLARSWLLHDGDALALVLALFNLLVLSGQFYAMVLALVIALALVLALALVMRWIFEAKQS